VTSREALGIAGELTIRVPSLSLPAPHETRTLESLNASESVRLFIDRAAMVQPTFQLTLENAPSVVQICQRLDGIPLAIELAAVRVQFLTVDQIAHRLDDRFRLLTGGSRTALPRQQTLRALIDWSHDLLSKSEQLILHRLSIFSGGWTLDAAEYVCADCESGSAVDLLNQLSQLVNKSLVVVEQPAGREARYHLLETIRQYAREKMFDSGMVQDVREKHFNYYWKLAANAQKGLESDQEIAWVLRLEGELDNLNTALEWSLDNQPRKGVLLFFKLRRFWKDWMPFGIQSLENLLQTPELCCPCRERAIGLTCLSYYYSYAVNPTALAIVNEAIAILIDEPEDLAMAFALHVLGLRESTFDMDRGSQHLQASLDLYRKLGLHVDVADVLNVMGTYFETSDYSRAHSFLEEALMNFRKAGLSSGVIQCLSHLAALSLRHEELEHCRAYLQQALDILANLNLSSFWCKRLELAARAGVFLSFAPTQ
jgi:non-specific serine/threonine protein kinase